MIIGIDGNEANVERPVGVSVYTKKLLEHFKTQATSELKFIVHLRKKPFWTMPEANEHFIYRILPYPFAWSQFFLPRSLNSKKDVDVFFSPAHYAPRGAKVKTVVTVHDLAYYYYPQEFLKKDLYKLINWTSYSVTQAQKVICVSRTTRSDLIKYLKVDEDKVDVVHNGFEKDITEEKKPSVATSLIAKKYILYVGTLQPRKNIPLLIGVFSEFKKKHPEFKLVITGRKGWLYEKIFEEVKNLKLEKDVYFTGYLEDSELAYLYRNAFCFALPSLYEGFGMPILEAMSYDCPVISSNTSSLPEVGGEACLYFDPQSPQELLQHFEFLYSDKQVTEELIKKGRERIKLFSWKTCTSQTLKVLKAVASNK